MDRPSKYIPSQASTLQITPPCQLCTRLFSQEGLDCLNTSGGFRYWTRAECVVSGNDGCRMCQFVMAAINEEEYDKIWKDDEHIVFRNIRTYKAGMYTLHGCLESDPDTCIIEIYPFAKKNNPAAKLVRRRPLRRNFESERTFKAAKYYIKKCTHSQHPHKRCQYSRSTVLPKRVIDVGQPQELPAETIRLQTNEIETHAPYLALSYCWGKSPKLRITNKIGEAAASPKPLHLRRNTLESMNTNPILIETLQPSIRDAITVTRRLGFRYLWVDALCIIQDCERDRTEQLSAMASIYKNAAITIAAASSRSAYDGFLRPKTPRPYCPDFDLNIPVANGKKTELGKVYLLAGAYEPNHPLDKRAWTLQEFLLSSRLLIFSDYELLWQCKEVELRSVFDDGLDYLQPLQDLPWAVFDYAADYDGVAAVEPDYGVLDMDKLYMWRTITQQYTNRELTHKEDRLPAIQGIITELETLWNDRNIYGLWEGYFVQLLAWYKPVGCHFTKRHLQRAPSWSWASLDGAIAYEGILSTEDATVKCLTISMVQLTCKILRDEDLPQDGDARLDSISECLDLADSTELEKRELQHKDAGYLLLGTIQEANGSRKGVGLLVVDVGKGLYRRLGLSVFADMTLWNQAALRTITLEPKSEVNGT